MFFKQYYLGCLAHASYLIGDEATGVAIVVDPQRDIEQYVEDAEAAGLSIGHVALTHFHADFLAGHLELRESCGATIYLGEHAVTDYEISPLRDGDRIELGDVSLECMETPGHTPEGISLLIRETPDAVPYGVLTGDTLFIGDVGRPDLLASVGVTAEELGVMLYHSLHDKLMKLPEETRVYPAHGAGSMCGKNISSEKESTIGVQRATNYALQPMDEDAFVAMVTEGQNSAPAYFSYDATLNRRERGLLTDLLSSGRAPLSVEDLLRLRNQGAQLLDTRDADEFALGYIVGSLNVGLNGQFATWAGSLLDPERPILLICNAERLDESVTRLGRIGFDRVVGFLEGGIDAAAEQPELVGRYERTEASDLRARLTTAVEGVVLDIRAPSELMTGGIDGSVHIQLGELSAKLDSLPREKDIVVYCAGGYRSSMAASILLADGFASVSDLRGGYGAWEAASA